MDAYRIPGTACRRGGNPLMISERVTVKEWVAIPAVTKPAFPRCCVLMYRPDDRQVPASRKQGEAQEEIAVAKSQSLATAPFSGGTEQVSRGNPLLLKSR